MVHEVVCRSILTTTVYDVNVMRKPGQYNFRALMYMYGQVQVGSVGTYGKVSQDYQHTLNQISLK